MQDISIVTSRQPIVYRPEGSKTVYLTFEGLRESRTIADKLTRIRVALPARLATELLSDCSKPHQSLIRIEVQLPLSVRSLPRSRSKRRIH